MRIPTMKSSRSGAKAAAKATAPAQSPSTAEAIGRAVRRVATSVRSAFFSSSSIMRGKSAYEAASPSARVQSVPDVGPNGALQAHAVMRARSRHGYRNNPLIRQAIRSVAANVIGYGIKPVIPFPDLAELWNDWVEEADARGQLDFYGMQFVGVQTTAMGGETGFRFRDRKEKDGLAVPFQIQMMEGDHIPLTLTQIAENGNEIIAGVERDAIDRVVAYHIYRRHPGDVSPRGADWQTVRVPAEDFILMFMPERPGDTRGVPWMSSSLNKFDGIDTWDDAALERQKTTTMYGGFFRKPVDADDGSVPGAAATDEEDVILQPLEPSTFVELPQGYSVDFANPPGADPNSPALRRDQVAGAAVSVGLAFEHITLNFEKLGDRQFRALMLEVTRLLESVQHHMVVQQLCKPVWRRFVQTAILSGKWTPPEGARERDYMRVEWMPPARGHIHPVQEISAYAEAIRAGITSRKRVAAELGVDVSAIDIENGRDAARAKEAGVVYSVYPGTDGALPPPSDNSAAITALEKAEMEERLERLEAAEGA